MFRRAFEIFRWISDEEKRERALLDDYRSVFGGDAGRRVLADILNCGQIANSTGHLTNRRYVDVNDGRRQLALEIFDKAGGARDRLTSAIINDDIKEALNHVRNTEFADAEPGRRAAEPIGAGGDAAVTQSGDDEPDAVISLSD